MILLMIGLVVGAIANWLFSRPNVSLGDERWTQEKLKEGERRYQDWKK